MSAFSFWKKGRQQAKKHNPKEPESGTQEPKAQYKHVPTHAGVDALSGAPNSWQRDYRSRIREQSRRRSALVVAEASAIPVALPRTSSSLSYVSYPQDYTSPIASTPKAQSSSSLPPARSQRSPASRTMEDYFTQSASRKGKERECIPSKPTSPLAQVQTSGIHSRPGNETSEAPYSSRHSDISSSSEDDLEVRHVRPVPYSPSTAGYAGYLYDPTRLRGVGATGWQNTRPAPQKKDSDSHTSRGYRFTAPQPIDHKALGFYTTIPPFPVPPVLSSDSMGSSPAISNAVSYASSARSGSSTTPSSSTSTPAASILASYPFPDKPVPPTHEAAGRMSSPNTTTAPNNVKTPGPSQRNHNDSKPNRYSLTAGTFTTKYQVSQVKHAGDLKKRRWSFLGAR